MAHTIRSTDVELCLFLYFLQPVGLGGAFLLAKGKANLHIMVRKE